MKPKRKIDATISDRWEIWPTEGDKFIVTANLAVFEKGALNLYYKGANVGMFREFRAAVLFAHAGRGLEHTWVNDGIREHIVEANCHEWNKTTGKCVFIQSDKSAGIDTGLVAVFPHASWWVKRYARVYA